MATIEVFLYPIDGGGYEKTTWRGCVIREGKGRIDVKEVHASKKGVYKDLAEQIFQKVWNGDWPSTDLTPELEDAVQEVVGQYQKKLNSFKRHTP